MRWLPLLLAALAALIQYPLWLGKGGWLRVWEMERRLTEAQEDLRSRRTRNAALDAEVRDLKQGLAAIEERARYELGMIRPGETFFLLPHRKNKGLSPSERE